MKRLTLIGLIAYFAIALAGCQARRDHQDHPASDPWADEGQSVIVQSEPIPVAKQLAGQTGVVKVVMTDTGFDHGQVRVPVGAMVKLHLQNKGAKQHNFVVPRFHIATSTMAPGAENYVSFTANEKGDWAFFSDEPGEPEPGLSGLLKVE